MIAEPRDQALELLYEADQRGLAAVDTAGAGSKAARLAQGVLQSRPELDSAIEAASEHWSLERMPPIDRSILRIGLYELLNSPEIPAAVIISEAVRLAKTYSTEKSGAFVNGVLGNLAGQARPHDEVGSGVDR